LSCAAQGPGADRRAQFLGLGHEEQAIRRNRDRAIGPEELKRFAQGEGVGSHMIQHRVGFLWRHAAQRGLQ